MSQPHGQGLLLLLKVVMADSSTTDSSKKRTRGVTALSHLTARRNPDHKYELEWDAFTGQPTGPNAASFKSYVGMLGRSKASILISQWRSVDDITKNLIWQDILTLFDVPNDEKHKKKWISYAGERWKDFKAQLTRKYVFGKGDEDGNTNPCLKYRFISGETWQMFVRSREEEAFQNKRRKGLENSSKNIYPHLLSRGGYQKLKEKIKEERMKEMQEDAGDEASVLDEPPQPTRYELWLMARQKASGAYTNEATTLMASKIESLVEESTQGTFVPCGRQDILTTAIGTPEHPGRVRTAGRGVGLKKYYGGPSRCASTVRGGEEYEVMRQEIMQEVTQMFKQQMDQFRMEVYSQQQSQEPVPSPRATVRVSTKASCSPDNEEEVELPKEEILTKLGCLSFTIVGGGVQLDGEHDHVPVCWVDKKDLTNLAHGNEWLSNSHLSLWCTYLYRLCIEKGTNEVYGFLDPTDFLSNRTSDSQQTYLQNKINDEQKDCFLAPYLYRNHWQLMIICPKDNLIVWICSLHKKPNSAFKRTVDIAMEGYNLVKHGLRKKKPDWVYPQGAYKLNAWACGYYVMKTMLTIVTADIVSGWTEVFSDSSEYTTAEIKEIRETWAHFFFQMLEEKKRRTKSNEINC